MTKSLIRLFLLTIATLIACSSKVDACKVPVFRYALERWPADQYSLVALVNGDQDDETSRSISALRTLGSDHINAAVEIIDLATLSEAELWSVEGLENSDQAPTLQVFYPERNGQRRLCWSGPLTLPNVNAWTQSPFRHQIVDDLCNGMTAVWILVEGDDPAANESLKEKLESGLDRVNDSITIPNGVIQRADAARHLSTHPGASMDDVLRCDLPLEIKFSVRALRYQDADEMAIRAMIDGWSSDIAVPFVFPVFGRGRMIDPLPAAQLDTTAITAACHYLVGECSCSVKALNPGVDLLLAADWQARLGTQIVMVDSIGGANEHAKADPIVIPPGQRATIVPSNDKSTVDSTVDSIGPSTALPWVVAIMVFFGAVFWYRR